MKNNNKWFSIIEILVWILIFSIWLTWVYAIILSTMNLNEYSKNSVIATNLANESIEDIRNLRDNNYKKIFKWNKLPWNVSDDFFSTWVYYKVENDFSSFTNDFLKIDIINNFWEWKSNLTTKMLNYQLCIDSNNMYTYNCIWNKKTYFYRYVKFDDIYVLSWWVNLKMEDSLKLTSKVIWYSRWYHEVELKTILTDYLRQ